MLKHNELRRLGRALGHGKQGTHAELFHRSPIQNLNFQPEFTGQRAGLIGQKRGRADIRRQIGKILGELKPVGQGLGIFDHFGRLSGAHIARQQHLDMADAFGSGLCRFGFCGALGSAVVFFGFKALKAIAALTHIGDMGRHPPGARALTGFGLNGHIGQKGGDALDAF